MYKPVFDDAKVRSVVVGKQREIEEQLKTGEAIFVVPSMLTPMFVSAEHVIFDEEKKLYAVKDVNCIPDGLIPQAKLADPAQLSTVLARVLSVRAMLDRNIKLTVLYYNAQRPKEGKPQEFVDASEIEGLKQRYKNLHMVQITQELYDEYKDKVCAATYRDLDEDGAIRVTGINATQINQPSEQKDWGVKADQAMIDKIHDLSKLLVKAGLEPVITNKMVIVL